MGAFIWGGGNDRLSLQNGNRRQRGGDRDGIPTRSMKSDQALYLKADGAQTGLFPAKAGPTNSSGYGQWDQPRPGRTSPTNSSAYGQ